MKNLYLKIVTLVASLMLATAASAAVPTDITDLLTALATDFGTLLTAGLVLWAAIKGPMVVWSLARRVIGKAQS